MSVRAINESDRPAVLAMAHRLWGGEPGWEDSFVGFAVLVWEEADGSLGGFASIGVRPYVNGADSRPCPHLEGWFVEPHLRRRGIGRALIQAVEAWCRAGGFAELTSDVLVDNTTSLAMHSALGFEATDRVQYFRKRLAGVAVGRGRPE